MKMMSAPSVSKVVAACQRLVEAVHRACVGAGKDQDVGIGSGIDGCTNLHPRFGARDHLLAAGVTAFLRADLVLDHHGRRAGAGVFRHRALDVESITVAGVAVSDHRNLAGAGAATAQTVEHLGERDQPSVRQPEAGG